MYLWGLCTRPRAYPRRSRAATPTTAHDAVIGLWNLWGELTCPFCGYEHEVPRAITAAAAFAEAERAYREAKDAIYGDLAEAAGITHYPA